LAVRCNNCVRNYKGSEAYHGKAIQKRPIQRGIPNLMQKPKPRPIQTTTLRTFNTKEKKQREGGKRPPSSGRHSVGRARRNRRQTNKLPANRTLNSGPSGSLKRKNREETHSSPPRQGLEIRRDHSPDQNCQNKGRRTDATAADPYSRKKSKRDSLSEEGSPRSRRKLVV